MGRLLVEGSIFSTVSTTVLFATLHSLLYGELLNETCYIKHPIKYQHTPTRNKLYMFTFKLLVSVIVTLHPLIDSENFIISFYNFNLSNPCILHSWKWPYIWPKHLALPCAYQVIAVYLCACVVTVIFCIRIMHGLWIIYICSSV